MTGPRRTRSRRGQTTRAQWQTTGTRASVHDAHTPFSRLIPHLSSVDRSWSSRASPHKTRGLTPSDYSQSVQSDFLLGESTKRHDDIFRATAEFKPVPKPKPVNDEVRPEDQFSRSLPVASSAAATRRGPRKAVDPFRPARIPQVKPPLIPPFRAKSNGKQRQNYIYAGSAYKQTVPNPALPPVRGELAKQFPYNSRPTHHAHAINPQVTSGYYSTNWDDRHFSNPYEQHDVQVISTARPAPAVAEEQATTSRPTYTTESSHPLSPSVTRPCAAALGFGARHSGYTQYIHHSHSGVIPSETSRANFGPVGPGQGLGSTADRIVMPLAPHLIPTVAPGQTPAVASDLALSVPYNLSRFVPMDSRDGDGKLGHLNASGLGYGPGHRNHYKYVHDNREGNPELAYFRSNHVS